ncbi:methylated-DNA--[protein]-cysteine S-methyltransferase [Aeoliella sp. SH292]|uniref:methylated-DNA--[protein]-cysteine S-methyltransferase n=1 Tax=Aeoliella sp. SH292 TaxID=3454464 RepID=UPI003F99DE80
MPASIARPAAQMSIDTLGVCFETKLGWMALGFTNRELVQLVFGQPNLSALMRAIKCYQLELVDHDASLPEWVLELRQSLIRFAEGEPQDFRKVPIATDHLTSLAKKVVSECRKIAWGKQLTYAELAARAGRPGAARAVGSVMAKNRYPLVVPCHRVVGSGGGLGGYSAPGGLDTKRALLATEGSMQTLFS